MTPKYVCVIGAVAICLTGGRLWADSIDPLADEILRRMSRHLAEADQFSFEADDMIDEILDNGQKIQFSSSRRLTVRRPNRVAAEITGDTVSETIRYDGRTLTILDKLANVYGSMDVPDNIDDMLDYVAENFRVTMPLADLIFSDTYSAVIGQVRIGQYVGLHTVQGVKCHHLAFRQDGLDWQIWIEDSDTPWPRKLVITYKSSPGQPQYIAFLNAWDRNPKLDETAFILQVPETASKIDLRSYLPEKKEQRAPAGASAAPKDDSR